MSTPPSITPAPTVTMTAADLSALVEAEVTKALASQPGKITWAKIRGNKYFVLATSTLAGAIAEQIFEGVKNHTFAWNTKSLGALLTSAAGSAFIALYHLYTQPASGVPDKSQ